MKKLVVLGTLALVLTVVGFFGGGNSESVVEEESAAVVAGVSPRVLASGTSGVGAYAEGPWEEVRVTKACFETDDCDFPQTDPQSYSFAVGRKLAGQLSRLRETYGSDPSRFGELAEVAKEMMAVQDGFVQEEAIKIFSLLPPSSESVSAMVSGLENAHSPLLIEQAMKEWERYIGSPEEAMIQEFLADFVARGGQFSSEKASEKILAFLNDRTVSSFREALATMIPESTQARNLRAALQEYERLRSGG